MVSVVGSITGMEIMIARGRRSAMTLLSYLSDLGCDLVNSLVEDLWRFGRWHRDCYVFAPPVALRLHER
jgi:hypothetical protein